GWSVQRRPAVTLTQGDVRVEGGPGVSDGLLQAGAGGLHLSLFPARGRRHYCPRRSHTWRFFLAAPPCFPLSTASKASLIRFFVSSFARPRSDDRNLASASLICPHDPSIKPRM